MRAVDRILVATDRSETAERAVAWAADMARRYEAELIVLHVLVPDEAHTMPDENGAATGERARTRVVVHADPARAIVDAAKDENADVVVVGNVGMRSRRRFLVGNVPNLVAHKAPCTVVIVDTTS